MIPSVFTQLHVPQQVADFAHSAKNRLAPVIWAVVSPVLKVIGLAYTTATCCFKADVLSPKDPEEKALSSFETLPPEILENIFKHLPNDLPHIALTCRSTNAVLKSKALENVHYKKVLKQLKKRFQETGLTKQRFKAHQDLVIHRLTVEGKTLTFKNIWLGLTRYQDERFPNELSQDVPNPTTLSVFLEREAIIKDYNTFLFAKRLVGTHLKESVKNAEELKEQIELFDNLKNEWQTRQHLDMSGVGLTEIPAAVKEMPQLENLFLNNNRLTTLETDTFLGTNLIQIGLEDNQLAHIQNEAFSGTNNLQYLYLDNNDLTSVKSNFFSDMTALRTLSLAHNRLSEIEDESFSRLVHLLTLDLKNNQLTEVRENTFAGLTRLKTLNLSDNRLTSIQPGSFAAMGDLTTLKLGSNLLTNTEQETFSGLTHLKTLVLSDNRLTSIHPGSFDALEKLRLLMLNGNLLEGIEEDTFSGLSALQELNLGRNQLTRIDLNTFNGLSSLVNLGLYNNDLTEFDFSLCSKFPNLSKLDLTSNQIESLTLEPKTLRNLKILRCQGNPLTHLSENLLSLSEFSAMKFFIMKHVRIVRNYLSANQKTPGIKR